MKAAIEAVLFTMGGSVEAGRLAAALEIDDAQLYALMVEMMEDYNAQERGIRIIQLENRYQLCTKKEYYEILIRIAKQPRKVTLTDVLMETLAIIAYRQPVTKVEIEKIRGVKCDHAVNKLVEYGLAQELGRMDAPGRPILFGTTEEFLRCFGVQSMSELPPDPDPVKMADFKAEAEEEIKLKLDI
jgi:segregation and condensation protein B